MTHVVATCLVSAALLVSGCSSAISSSKQDAPGPRGDITYEEARDAIIAMIKEKYADDFPMKRLIPVLERASPEELADELVVPGYQVTCLTKDRTFHINCIGKH